MYATHQGAQSVRTIFSSPEIHYDRDGKPATFSGLSGSASLNHKDLTLTVVNPHISEAREAEIAIRGANIRATVAAVLTNSDIHAHNSFAHPDALVPATKNLALPAKNARFAFPPASVTSLALSLE
jgi:alpha-N-arabinofuranosidase